MHVQHLKTALLCLRACTVSLDSRGFRLHDAGKSVTLHVFVTLNIACNAGMASSPLSEARAQSLRSGDGIIFARGCSLRISKVQRMQIDAASSTHSCKPHSDPGLHCRSRLPGSLSAARTARRSVLNKLCQAGILHRGSHVNAGLANSLSIQPSRKLPGRSWLRATFVRVPRFASCILMSDGSVCCLMIPIVSGLLDLLLRGKPEMLLVPKY